MSSSTPHKQFKRFWNFQKRVRWLFMDLGRFAAPQKRASENQTILLQKIGFDTADNEPPKIWQNLQEILVFVLLQRFLRRYSKILDEIHDCLRQRASYVSGERSFAKPSTRPRPISYLQRIQMLPPSPGTRRGTTILDRALPKTVKNL